MLAVLETIFNFALGHPSPEGPGGEGSDCVTLLAAACGLVLEAARASVAGRFSTDVAVEAR